MKKPLFVLLLVIALVQFAKAQTIRINELSASNSSVIQDEFGDYPDWIELYNLSTENFDFSNLFLSDDPDELTKWQFPQIILEPDSLLLVFASGKDIRNTVRHWETIVREGDYCKFLLPQSNPNSNWKDLDFNDESWNDGIVGIGYGDDDDNTIISQTISAYLRLKFSVTNINEINNLILHMDYDDGFIAYLNGNEIARENLGEFGSEVFYNTVTTDQHEAQIYQGLLPNKYPLLENIDLLQEGENILAIEVHNISSTSSDLSIIPFLSIGYSIVPPETRGDVDFLNLQKGNLHTNFKISAGGETILISNSSGQILDSIYSRSQLSDISLGSFPNGSENYFFFDNPTPGKKNLNDGFPDFLDMPVFNYDGGFYNNAFFLNITNPNSIGTIHYTLDGSEPTENSSIYTNEIVVSGISVVRAKIFGDGFLPSRIQTNTYFINTQQNLATISLTTNPDNFFDWDSGIYVMGPNAEPTFPYFGANFWQDWERPIHVEFYEKSQELGFELDAGVKIFGKWSRGNSQKSLAIFARGRYGYSEIAYKLFEDSEIESFQNFVLRNSGNDWNRTMFRDALMQEIVRPLDIDKQNYRPVAVYLNGEYWGVHNMRSKINEHFIESNHGVPTDDLNMIENYFEVVHGDSESYLTFYNSLEGMDLTTESAFNYIDEHVDVNEFADYFISQIFFDNEDWPGNNIKFWQQRSTQSPWRWILYDTDFGFGLFNTNAYTNNTLEFALEENGPDWPNPPWSTFLLRKFLENQTFKNIFLARYSVYLNTIFKPQQINDIITRFENELSPEMPTHFARWNGNFSSWGNEVSTLRNFANSRYIYSTIHLMGIFGISGQYQLQLNQDNTKGRIEICGFKIYNEEFTGSFLKNIPISIKAQPLPGYAFSHWEGSQNSTENPIILNTDETQNLTPVYDSDGTFSIVINEINYHSADNFDTEDWVELYNYSDSEVNISNWVFKDQDASPYFTIPENTIIDANSYIVLCKDKALFQSFFPTVENVYGDLGFGLSGSGELIRLFDSDGNIVDSLTYDDKYPWPEEPDGDGATLELKNYTLNNSLASSWSASENHGTPGEQNSVFTSNENETEIIPTQYKLYQNYPNPFSAKSANGGETGNPSTTIKFSIPPMVNRQSSMVSLKVYDVLGKEIAILVNEQKPSGNYVVTFDASKLTSGVYFYRLQSGNFVDTKKMILLK